MRGSGTSWGRAAALVGVLGAIGPGCRAELPPAALHDAIAEWFRTREGIAVDAVRCPKALPKAPGEAMTCTVTLDHEVVEVTAEVVDDEGTLSLQPRHATVVAARAEPEIAATLRAQGIAVDRIDCDGVVWVARPGAEHRCEVTAQDGRRFAWHGVWSGEGTRQRTTVVPLPGVGPGEGTP